MTPRDGNRDTRRPRQECGRLGWECPNNPEADGIGRSSRRVFTGYNAALLCERLGSEQAGPRRLWDRVEEAYAFWQRAGCPPAERFGITASATEQYVWYEHPTGEHRWPLPTTTP